eukprot:SAG11_NODE_1345_length_5147_cov_3.840729_5_plen_67_part_00
MDTGTCAVPYHFTVAKQSAKILAAPLAAGMIESAVSNRAEVQRFYGARNFLKLQHFGIQQCIAVIR